MWWIIAIIVILLLLSIPVVSEAIYAIVILGLIVLGVLLPGLFFGWLVVVNGGPMLLAIIVGVIVTIIWIVVLIATHGMALVWLYILALLGVIYIFAFYILVGGSIFLGGM